MIRADEDGVALEELVGPAGGLEERADRAVGVRERVLAPPRPVGVRREVVVGQVEDEEVEAVPRDEPAADDAAYSSTEPRARVRMASGAPVTSDSNRL